MSAPDDGLTLLLDCHVCDASTEHVPLVIQCSRCHTRTGLDAVAAAQVLEAAARLPLDLRVRACADPGCSMYLVGLATSFGPPPASCPACGMATVLMEGGTR